MSEDRDDFLENGDDDEEFNRQFLEKLQKTIEDIRGKLDGDTPGDVTIEDVAQYVRVINYNFAALSGTLFRLYTDQKTTLETITDILNKLTSLEERFGEFVKVNSCIDDMLDNDKNESDS